MRFLATLRRKVFDMESNLSTNTYIKIQEGVLNNYIDIPNENLSEST